MCVKNRCTGEVGTYVVEMCSSKITSFGVYVDTDVDSRNVNHRTQTKFSKSLVQWIHLFLSPDCVNPESPHSSQKSQHTVSHYRVTDSQLSTYLD